MENAAGSTSSRTNNMASNKRSASSTCRNKREVIKMVKKQLQKGFYALVVAGATLAVSTTLRAANWASMADGTFISTQMFLSVQSGWSQASAWTDRGDIAKSSAMTPMGDGTFQLRLDLVPDGQYNYIFFAGGSTNTATSGFNNGSVNAEPVPAGGINGTTGLGTGDQGTFFSASSNTVTVLSSGSAGIGYGRAGTGQDGRRMMRMPDVTAGTTVWVYNNFASTPVGVANTNVNVKETSLDLSWKGALGYFGAGSGSMDILGGRIRIYVSTNAVNGPYSLVADLAGTATGYTHGAPMNVTQGTSYFFVFVTSDTYGGATDPTTYAFNANLTREGLGNTTPPNGTYKTNAQNFERNDLQGKPAAKVPTYFKVQKPDLDYILAHDSIVYLTPLDVDDPMYPYKIPAKLVVAYIPPKHD